MIKTCSCTYIISLILAGLISISAAQGQEDYYTGDEAEDHFADRFRLGWNSTRSLYYLMHSYKALGYNIEPQLQVRVHPHAHLLFSGGIAQRYDKTELDNWRYHMTGNYAKVGVLIWNIFAISLTTAMYREYGNFIFEGNYFPDQKIHIDDRCVAFGMDMMVDPGITRIHLTDNLKLHFQGHFSMFLIDGNDHITTVTVPGHGGGGRAFGVGGGLNMFLFFGI
jgi:hypothetical protein